jgi:RNA polymerase sigma-70 factor (ECF subfamily)
MNEQLAERADHELVAGFTTDPRASFEALYRKYVDRIHAYVMRRVGNADLAQDITQKCFLRAYEAMPRYREQGKPYLAFLYRIASNEITSEWRKSGKVKTEEIEEHHAVTEQKTDALEAEHAQKLVHAHLPELSEDFRLVLELRYFAHLNPDEISSMTGWTTNKVGVVHHRALRKLESLMKG